MRVVIGLIELRIAAIGLICLGSGIALCLYTLRLWREARPESPALAPLEVMSDDAFINGDDRARRDLLQMAREIAAGVAREPQRQRPTPREPRMRPVAPRRTSTPTDEEGPRRAPIDPLLK